MIPQPIANSIIQAASEHSHYSVDEILGDDRSRHLTRVRWAIMATFRERGFSTVEIGKALQRCHGTVIRSLRKAAKIKDNPDFAKLLEALA